VCERYRKTKSWFFRGHANEKWELVPKAGRPEFSHVDDQKYFEAWKRRAVEYLPIRPNNDWDWLSIAQHHGLATRLLDWTMNPLNAAFFAVRHDYSGPAIVYAANFTLRYDGTGDPMNISGVGTFFPSGIVPRITRQWGTFSIHPKPKVPLAHNDACLGGLEKLVIESKYRKKLKHSWRALPGIIMKLTH
jgi:hypothetical protein